MRLAVLAMTAALLAACGPGERFVDPPTDGTPTVEPPTEGTPTEGTPTEEQPPPAAASLTGVFGGDTELEGGCAWLETADRRWEVLWPEGYRVEWDPLRLIGPDEEVVARAGDTVRVTGEEAPDVMSICQIGPIWRAETVQETG